MFGGNTSERQVSLTSGVNVWLKLRSRPDFDVTPALLAPDSLDAVGSKLEDATVFRLSYARALRHREEVAAAARARTAARVFFMTGAAPRERASSARVARRFLYDAFDADDDVEKEDASTISRVFPARVRVAGQEQRRRFPIRHGGVSETGRSAPKRAASRSPERRGGVPAVHGQERDRRRARGSAPGRRHDVPQLQSAWEMSEAPRPPAAAAPAATSDGEVSGSSGSVVRLWWRRSAATRDSPYQAQQRRMLHQVAAALERNLWHTRRRDARPAW